MAPGFYAVHKGRVPGIYGTWNDCQHQVSGFSGASFKKFKTESEALAFVAKGHGQTSASLQSSAKPSSSTATLSEQGTAKRRKRAPEPPLVLHGSASRAELGEGGSSQADHIIEVYTDGASSNNGRHGARAGYGVHFPDRPDLDESERVPGDLQTNNRGELLAIIRAIQINPSPDAQLRIHTDSMYCVNAINQWQYTWRANHWQKAGSGRSTSTSSSGAQNQSKSNGSQSSSLTSTDKAVLNRDLIRRLEFEMRKCKHRPILQHVKGHANSVGNRRADQLAVAGAAKSSCLPGSEDHGREPSPSDDEADSKSQSERMQALWTKGGFTVEPAAKRVRRKS